MELLNKNSLKVVIMGLSNEFEITKKESQHYMKMKGEEHVKEKEKEFEKFIGEALKTIILLKTNTIYLVEIGNT